MATEQQKQLIEFAKNQIKKYETNITHNKNLFEIYEGDLLSQILADVSKQFSIESFEILKCRIAPINILKRTVDKLSTIYSKPIKRSMKVENKTDEELLKWYEENFDINNTMNIANELYNLHKSVVVEPYVDGRMPKLRSVPSDRSIMLSQDYVDSTRPTMWVKMMGKTTIDGTEKEVIYIYTKDAFIPATLDGEVLGGVLANNANPGGVNPLQALPGVYINQSHHCIVPQMDTDVLQMTKIIPIILSDLNYAVMFQSFAILYGIDVDVTNLRMSPNAFWTFKSDPTSEKTPQVGAIKPNVDIQQVVGLVQAQLTFWLNSKNIRPGTIGGLTTENFASGISKAIDEMDTVEARQKQIPQFMKAEKELWNLIITKLHPYWMKNKMINTNLNFSAGAEVVVEFPEQLPMSDREQVLKNQETELKLQLTTRKRAIKTLNPEMGDKEIEVLLQEIEEENTVEIETEPPMDGANNNPEQPMDNLGKDNVEQTLPI